MSYHSDLLEAVDSEDVAVCMLHRYLIRILHPWLYNLLIVCVDISSALQVCTLLVRTATTPQFTVAYEK